MSLEYHSRKLSTELFVLREEFHLSQLIDELEKSFSLLAESPVDQRLVYLDTYDWRLHDQSLRLRVKYQNELQLLQCLDLTSDECCIGHVEQLPVFKNDLKENLEGSDLKKRALSQIQERRLFPVANISHHGQQFRLLNQDEKTVARILVDQYQAQATATQQSPQRLPVRVTVKPVKGYPNVLKRVTEVLAILAQRIVSFDDPLDSTLAAFNVVPDYTLTSFDVPLNPNTPPEFAALQLHVHLLKMLRHQEAGVREDLDTQFLHNFRTAVSRIRAVIKEIPGVFSQKTAKHFNAEFRWLEQVTANKHSLDLQRLAMEKSIWRLDNKYEAATLNAFLTDHMTHEIKMAQHDINQTLDSQRYTTLLHEWTALLQNSSLSDYEATNNAGLNGTSSFNNHSDGIVDGYDGYSANGHTNTIKMFAQQAIQSRFDRIVREGQRIKASSRPQKLHDIRVDCTRLHNLLDCFRSLFDDGYFSSVVTSLNGIEKHLNQFDSLATQQDHIEQFAQALAADPSADHRILLSLGKISERLHQAHEEKRRTFHKRFDSFTDQATRQSLTQMFDPLDSAALL